jgi:hypothetical protein
VRHNSKADRQPTAGTKENTMKVRITTAAVIAALALVLTGCGSSGPATDQSVPATATATSSTVTAPDTAAVKAAEVAKAKAAAAKKAADKKAAAVAAAKKAAAEKAAAAKKAAEQAAAAKAAEEKAAAEKAAADAEVTTTAPAPDSWYDSRGWVSPETAKRALAAGIPWGGDVPGYLRCGTICGESPTSGEAQMANGCAQGLPSFTPEMCAAGGYPRGGNAEPTPQPTTQAEEPWKTCLPAPPKYWINGTCYPSADAARAAGENVGD